MKWEVCQNINSLSSHPFYIKITPKGFSGHADFPGHIKSLKMPTSKFGQFWPFFAILCPLPPLKKFHFWLPDNYAWEGCQSNHCVQKPPKVHFLVLPRDQCQRNSPKKMKWEVCQNINSLSSHPFYIKITPKGFSGHAEFPGHLKSFKMPTSKFGQFWPFYAILCPLPPFEKIPFLAPRQLCMGRLPFEPLCPKTSQGTLFSPPKGPVSKKKPKEDEVRSLSEYQFVVKSSFLHKNHSQGVFWTRRVPWAHRKLKNANFKVWSIFAIFRHLVPAPPFEKIPFLAPRQLCMGRLPIEPLCPKTSQCTLFTPPKGPVSKK